jgi:nodulation protein E
VRRVVVTGIGTVSAGGASTAESWVSVRDAAQRVGPASRLSEGQSLSSLVAEIPDFDPERHFERRLLPSLDPVSQYAIVAAREAVAQAGIDFAALPPERTLCIVGTGAGGETTHDHAALRLYGKGSARLHPMTVPRIMSSAVASQLAMALGIRGGVFVVASACASSTHAIGQAALAIRSGMADVALTGGSEACLTFSCIKAWEALHVLTDDLCRPFSRGRRGLLLGEGSAIFVLEDYETARRRGAEILAEVKGFGMSSDAASLTSPDADGMARAMTAALADAGLPADAIDHVNTHGTGTNMNDSTEFAALDAVFGDRARRVPVTANKSVLGHALGASGALELAMSIAALREQVLAPTANFVEADPECPVDCVPNVARDARIGTILSNSFAFGGLNASLVVGHA